MTKENLEQYHRVVNEYADFARKLTKSRLEEGASIESKLDYSLVTNIDKELETLFREKISETFPSHGVLGEEFGFTNPSADFCWIIDPIDGTEELVYKTALFGTIISLHYKNEPIVTIYDLPKLNERISAVTGQGIFRNGKKLEPKDFFNGPLNGRKSRLNVARSFLFEQSDDQEFSKKVIQEFHNFMCGVGSVYAQSMTCLGSMDACLEWSSKPWDMSGAKLLAQESGKAYKVLKKYRSSSEDIELTCFIMGKLELVQRIEIIYKSCN